jgi:hypothetical protein
LFVVKLVKKNWYLRKQLIKIEKEKRKKKENKKERKVREKSEEERTT